MAFRLLRRQRRADFRRSTAHHRIVVDLDREYEKRWGGVQKRVCREPYCGGEMVKRTKKTRSADEGEQVFLVCNKCGKLISVGVT